MGIFSWLFGRDAIDLSGDGTFALDVVGESNYQKSLKKICGGYSKESQEVLVTATLIHENDNPHDKNAVRIDIGKRTVGYLGRDDARRHRRYIKKNGREGQDADCPAKIVGGWNRGRKDRGAFGVVLDMPCA